ncbi:type II secretion system protein GspL [Enterobacter cloacae subsp. cloacae]|jgi:general secretion pathway protein L|uniref:type II secretion system protein GspL n=1 Tax=Enterobacter cloacae TaxID=550 RepID=UPI0021D13D03|nr:type II secretion system protein GspL [Enterobacter cloacae]EKY1817840.1 type II secretion system protein GspL [Enterobacter cloacae]MCU6251210.1 type II secretion system protein GspL [Enterobacter cloacae]MDR9969855.1 type II secretion system protein GspL [Enterobacter cloacae subsp. cloacae]MDS0084364.1 type II secretion system protein GspL [Enterobacter cloacae subsp. cloacae]HAS1152614.1 type II secretion system protein GspL [Enterobacter cloacae]
MKQVLFIRPDTHEDGNIMWCESGSDQVEQRQGGASLAALAGHALAARVCLLLPASEMIFRRFTLPKKGSVEFSWLAEETLIGDVDTLHWTVLNKKGREVDAVAIDAARLQYWLDRCADAGLTVVQVLPDAILLPVTEGGSTLVSTDSGYWMRYSPFGACETDAALLPLLLSQQCAGNLVCYGDAPADVQVDEQRAWQHPLVLIQPQWKSCKANLLHGVFSATGAQTGFRYAKPALAAMAVLSLGLLVGPRIGMAWMLSNQENLAQQQMVELAQHYFPTLRQTTNLKYHFGQNIKKEKKGIFLQLDALEQIKQSLPAVELSEVGYDDTQNQLTLNIRSMDPTALQAFVNKASDTFDFTLQPVSSEAPYTAIITGKYK